MSKRKKPAPRAVKATTDGTTAETVQVETPPIDAAELVDTNARESVSTQTTVPSDVLVEAMETAGESERAVAAATESGGIDDIERTVNVTGDMLPFPGRDDLDPPTVTVGSDSLEPVDDLVGQRKHLRGALEALVFASDAPIKTKDLAKLADASVKLVTEVLAELRADYANRGIQLEEVAGGWVFRTSPKFAPYVRDLTKQRPVKLSRAQVETLAIIAYRQPVTRPEIDEVRGVDSGPVLKVLLERDLVRILGKREEPGRPLIYGTTQAFLEFFGLKSLKDLPTLREFTELTDESRQRYEEEMGEPPNDAPPLDEGASPYPNDREVAEDAHADGGQRTNGAHHDDMPAPVGETDEDATMASEPPHATEDDPSDDDLDDGDGDDDDDQDDGGDEDDGNEDDLDGGDDDDDDQDDDDDDDQDDDDDDDQDDDDGDD